jgi:hypothetical protein
VNSIAAVNLTHGLAVKVYGRPVVKRAVLLIALLAPLAAAAPSVAAPARVRDCAAKVDFNLEISSARNMRCRTAKRDLRRHRGSISRRFRTPGGFRCTRVSGTALGGQWRCVRELKAYRFEFGD